MRFLKITLILIFFSAMLYAADSYKVNPAESRVQWNGKKLTGEHTGTINLKSGLVMLENNRISGGEFVLDMSTIVDLDLQDPKWNNKLVTHLKSDDFFYVEKFPTASMVIRSVKAGEKAGEVMVSGDFTIKGITHSLNFTATSSVKDNQLTALATIVIDRSKFDVRYGSKTFFENIGDKIIYDEFTLQVSLKAEKIK